MMMKNIKTYSELITIPTFEERFEYLKLDGQVGVETFGFNRYLNQAFYKSDEWLSIRDYVITRDNGCDLGMEGYEIYGQILIHHINPITIDDVLNLNPCLTDLENLICVTNTTHNMIHYGLYKNSTIGGSLIYGADRKPNDTCPWKRR